MAGAGASISDHKVPLITKVIDIIGQKQKVRCHTQPGTKSYTVTSLFLTTHYNPNHQPGTKSHTVTSLFLTAHYNPNQSAKDGWGNESGVERK